MTDYNFKSQSLTQKAVNTVKRLFKGSVQTVEINKHGQITEFR